MSDGYTVDYNQLRDSAKKLESLKAEFDSARAALKLAADSVSPGYVGSDSDRFIQQVEAICKDLEVLSNHLENGVVMLENDATNYENNEADLTNKAGRLSA